MRLSLAVEGRELPGEAWRAACRFGVGCHKLWFLSAVVEALAPSCSPEKKAAWSQQLFLPGRQLPGGTSLVLLFVCLLLPRRLLVLCSCALKATESPWLWLLSATPLAW